MRKTNTRKKEQAAIVPIGLGFDRPQERTECLTFARTNEIALRAAGARESELRHIRRCNSCKARFRAFQREASTDPHHSVHQHIRHVVVIGLGGAGKSVVGRLIEIFAMTVYNSYRFSEEAHRDEGHSWHPTHTLGHVVHHAATLDQLAGDVLFKATETALVHAASTYTLSESMDDVWPLLEGMKEGAMAAVHVPRLSTRYAQLYAHVAAEAPPLVRQLLLVGIAELHDRGGEPRHFARTVLDQLNETGHAAEIAAACSVITHGAHKAVFISALEIERLHERIVRYVDLVRAALTDCDHYAVHFENLESQLHHSFADTTPRAQVIGLLTAKRAFEDAFEDAHAHGIDGHLVREFLCGLVLRSWSNRNVRPMLADAVLASTAARRYLVPYLESVLAIVRPHDLTPPALSAHERHGLVISVLEEYERGGLAPPRFEEEGHVWRVASEKAETGLDGYCHELAALATEHRDYAFHLEWANARFENTAHGNVPLREECAAR